MEHWCGSGSRAAAIVRWSALRHGEVPFGVREGTPPMDAAEAAWSVHGWFDERNVTAARSLYLEVEHSLDDVTHHDILRRVERALRSGELVAYRMRPWSEPARNEGSATHPPARAKPSAPKPSAPAPIEATVPTHFSVRWVDELNLPLSGVAVVFFISGRRHKATTGLPSIPLTPG